MFDTTATAPLRSRLGIKFVRYWNTCFRLLERVLQSQLPLPGDVVGKGAKNTACLPRAIDAGIGIGQVRMIGEVERFSAELHGMSFVDLESLKERHVHLAEIWSHYRIATYGAELRALRTLPCTIHLSVGGQRSTGGLKPTELVRIGNGEIADSVGTAPASVPVRTAIPIAGREGLASHIAPRAVELPTTQKEVHRLGGIGHELLTFAEGHFI